MATQSSPPPSSTDDKPPQNPAVEGVAEPTNEIGKGGITEQSSPSVFVNSEPMREEQVQNAVKFLSHPRVRGSPVMYRRSFLERKGLTKEEIDEAFRRVPDPPPGTQATTTTQEGQGKTTSYVQPQAQQHTLQPAAATSAAVVPATKTSVWSQFHWYHAVLAVGLLSASGAGTALFIKNAVIPRVKSWIRRIVMEEEEDFVKKSNKKPSLAEEAAVAAKAAAAAAADVARVSQEIANSKQQERRTFEELMNLLNDQVKEMKSMSASMQKLEATNSLERFPAFDQEDYRPPEANSKHTYANGKTDFETHSGRSFSTPASKEPSVAPHPKSYMEIMAMVQRGEKPPNIREIDDQPPNPHQQISNPRVAPRAKPWEVGQSQNGLGHTLHSQHSGEGLSSYVQENGMAYPSYSETAVPWWQKNPRITEIENEDENRVEPYGGRTNEQPIKRTWVPPQPPPVVMPEAAEAIRRPKASSQKEQSEEDQVLSYSTGISDELQRATKMSESGGVAEISGNGSASNSIEISEVQE